MRLDGSLSVLESFSDHAVNSGEMTHVDGRSNRWLHAPKRPLRRAEARTEAMTTCLLARHYWKRKTGDWPGDKANTTPSGLATK